MNNITETNKLSTLVNSVIGMKGLGDFKAHLECNNIVDGYRVVLMATLKEAPFKTLEEQVLALFDNVCSTLSMSEKMIELKKYKTYYYLEKAMRHNHDQ